jgi:hypothetical protein
VLWIDLDLLEAVKVVVGVHKHVRRT